MISVKSFNKVFLKGIVQNVLRRLDQIQVKQNQEEQKNKAGLKKMGQAKKNP